MNSIVYFFQLRKSTLLSIFAGVLVAAASIIAVWSFTPQSQAATVNDSYISNVSLSASSNTLGATATYTFTFTTSTALPSGEWINFYVMTNSGCQANDGNDCVADFSSSSISGLSGVIANKSKGYMDVQLSSDLAAGSKTVTVSNVVNPVAATAMRGAVSTSASNEETLLGSNFSSDNWYTTLSTTPTIFGTVVVSGEVSASGALIEGAWVDVHNANWTISGGAGVDEKGYYAVFQDYKGASYWQSGTYTISVYPQEGSGYVTTNDTFAYSGTAATKNVSLVAAEYFFGGTVTYGSNSSTTVNVDLGAAVTDASVCFNAQDGSGSYCDNTDENGEYSVAVIPGDYTTWLSPTDQATADWIFDGDEETYTMSEKGTTEVDFEVKATTAKVSGSVTVPDSSDLLDGSVGFTNATGDYWGGVNDGSYSLNLEPGTYEAWFYPDTNQNIAWAQYTYHSTGVTIAEGENEYNIEVEQLSATIVATVQIEDGTPVGDVEVQAWTDGHWTSAQTDANGQATLYIAADTLYEVGMWDEEWIMDSDYQYAQVLKNGSASLTIIVTLPDATIRGTVYDADGNVPSELYGWFGCETEDHSEYFGEDLRNGTVEIGVVTDTATGRFDGICSVYMPDENNGFVEPQEVSVASGDTVEIEFTLKELDAFVNTTVKNFGTGKKISPDPKLQVGLWNESDNIWHGKTLEDNPVTISVLSGKTYSGGVWGESNEYLPLWSMNSDTVNVKSGETGTLVLNVLKQDGKLKVKANDPKGEPLPYGWAWCGNWGEVDFAMDTVLTNVAIDSGADIKDGVAEVPLVSGHTYYCGVGAPENYIELGWLSPQEQVVEFKSSSSTLDALTFTFKEADANLQGAVKLNADVAGVRDAEDLDGVWCWAWSEGGSSWTEAEPGEDYRLNVDTSHETWWAGCDGFAGEMYYTSEPYEFTPTKGKNTHDFTLSKMEAWTIFDPVNETFDATENKVITYGDGTRLTIPAGTLATEGNITVRGTPETNIVRTEDHPLMIPIDWEAFDADGNLIETFPGGTVTIEIPYSDEALSEFGIDEDSLIGKYWDDLSGSWKKPDNVTLDKENNVITITTDHFTEYGVTYNARVAEEDTPSVPTLDVRKVDKHSAQLVLSTKKKYSAATRFVVQVRKAGSSSKANWKTTTLKNPKEAHRLTRTIQKLKSKTSYEVRAKACTTAGCSEGSAWEAFKTK